MKVKISNYPNRLVCNIHTNHMNKKYEGLSYENHTHEDHVLEVIEEVVQSVYNVFNWLWFDRRTQKVKVRIDKWDTWSMDHTLANIVLPMLVQLKRTKHGAPNVDMKDVPKELRATKAQISKYGKNGDTDPKFFERWDWILDEMIFAFESKVDDGRWEEQFESGTSDIQWKRLEGGNSEMIRGPNDTKVYDWEGRKAYQARISNGFKLFGKYFENLWD